ncbi:MAG: type II secretion system protein [Desulfobacterales bacterium]|jgi:prepilin-type N-terminal cleavage/methylation domain-containing protein
MRVYFVKMRRCRVENGFTLLEIIAVLVILSVLSAVAIPRYISLDENAKQKAINAGIAELNGRETLTWSNLKISGSGYQTDAHLFGLVDTTLGQEYSWDGGSPNISGGTLRFKQDTSVPLSRAESTHLQPAEWSR